MGYFLSAALSAIFVPLVIKACTSYAKNKKNIQNGKVYPALPLLIIGLIGSLPWIAAAILTAVFDQSIWFTVFFGAFSLLGLFLILVYINWRIYFDDHGFTVKSILGIKHRYSYHDVTATRETKDGTYIYMGKKRTSVGKLDIGGKSFVAVVRKQYQTIHGQQIPARSTLPNDIYKGNVEGGTVLFVMFCVIELILAILLIIIFLNCIHPNLEEGSQYTETSLTDFKILSDKDIRFYGEDGKLYVIEGYIAKHMDAKKLAALCDGDSNVCIYSHWTHPEDEPEQYKVYYLSGGGEELLTFDVSNAAFSKDQMIAFVVILLVTVAFGIFFIVSVIVGRNPDKHPKLFAFFFRHRAPQ